MNPQQKPPALTENGILYLSSGFPGPYTLQILACRQLKGKEYQLCLTDGSLYIGGRYQGEARAKDKGEIGVYAVVRVETRFVSKWLPVEILKLEVLCAGVGGLIGRPPTTLHDYFLENRQEGTAGSEEEREEKEERVEEVGIYGKPKKKVKLSSDQEGSSVEESIGRGKEGEGSISESRERQVEMLSSKSRSNEQESKPKEPQKQKQKPAPQNNTSLSQTQTTQKIQVSPLQPPISLLHNTETQILKPRSESEAHSSSEQLQLLELPPRRPIHRPPPSSSTSTKPQGQGQHLHRVYTAEENQIFVTKELLKTETHNTYISQLYERMLRWKILCRVTYLRKFISARGKKCCIFFLIDQKGDSIKSIYYYKIPSSSPSPSPSPIDSLALHHIYSFSGGQIIAQPNNPNGQGNFTASQGKNLEIVFDARCSIVEFRDIFMYPFSGRKCVGIGELREAGEVNVMGIVKGCELVSYGGNQKSEKGEKGEQYKARTKIRGTLCNPIEQLQIQFTKTIYPPEEQPPKPGTIVILNNFIPAESDNALKLTSTNNSYIVGITEEDIAYGGAGEYREARQLKKLNEFLQPCLTKQTPLYLSTPYSNLSTTRFTKRSISQLLSLSSSTQSPLYSQILISLSDLKLKKQYKACPFCRKSIIQQEHLLYQCLKCRKIVQPMPGIILALVLADCSGSLGVDAIGERVGVFLGVGVGEFCGLGVEEKECMMQIAKYGQFVVKVKTERKMFKELVHTLLDVQKQEISLTINEIRRRTVESKLKIEERWEKWDDDQ